MVDSILVLGRNGLSTWLLQRVSALILGSYAVLLIGFLICHTPLSYADWSALFACRFVKIATIMVLLSLVAHAWIGLWTVITDYVKCSCMRLGLELGLALGLLAYLLWGIRVLWG